MDFEGVAAALLARSRELIPQWLPGGRWQGHEWKCSDLQGGSGKSFSVNADSGAWSDFSSDGSLRGGDLIALYAAIHGIKQGEAFSELTDTLSVAPAPAPRSTADGEIQMHRFPTDNPLPAAFRHREFGTPSAIYPYRDPDGTARGCVARYETVGGGKEVIPWIHDGLNYRAKGFTRPRMLYGLDRLAALPATTRVLLVEGEKCADAAAFHFPKRPCMTWQGGTNAWKYADWAPLAGREVTLWPDNDEPGLTAMAGIAEKLLRLRCKVWRVNPEGQPPKWDIADWGGSTADLLKWVKQRTFHVELPPEEPPPPDGAPDGGHISAIPPRATSEYEEGAPGGGAADRVMVWQQWGLIMKQKGQFPVVPNSVNVRRAVEGLGGLGLYYNEFRRIVMYGEKVWDDFETSIVHDRLVSEFGIVGLSIKDVREGVEAYAYQHRKNPCREWLEGLTWDGVFRLGELFARGFGAQQSDYVMAVSRNFVTSMVARVFVPGCKADYVPILEGEQGEGKSSALKALGGEFYGEIHESMSTKDFYQAIQGFMLCELSELNSMRQKDVEHNKGVISTGVDVYRPPYHRYAGQFLRQCIFAGTTNRIEWNEDETGGRRFWPIMCGKIDREWILKNRDQIFAEGVARYHGVGDWWTVPRETSLIEQGKRARTDLWDERVADYCLGQTAVRLDNIASYLNIEIANQNDGHRQRIGKILRRLGFENRVRENKKMWIKVRAAI